MRGTSKHYRKRMSSGFFLNDRYKKSDECFKIIGNIGLDLYKTGCASKCRCKAATHAQDIKGSSVVSTLHHSLVLDKAHLVFSPCQTVCPYTHVVFLGFVYWIDAFSCKG